MQSWVLPTYHYTFVGLLLFGLPIFLSPKRIFTLVFPKKEIIWELNSFSGWATHIQPIFLHLHQLAYYCTLAGKINFPCLVGSQTTHILLYTHTIDEKEDMNTTTHILWNVDTTFTYFLEAQNVHEYHQSEYSSGAPPPLCRETPFLSPPSPPPSGERKVAAARRREEVALLF